MRKKQLQISCISKLEGKKTCGTVTLSSGQMERRSKGGTMRKLQWLQQHRREKCFAKPEEVIQSSQYAGLSLFFKLNPFSCICSQRPNFKTGNYGGDQSPEPVDETMSGNQFHCKNK